MKNRYTDEQFKESMKLVLDLNNMMEANIGKKGFTDEQIKGCEAIAKDAWNTVNENRGTGMMGWTELPYNQNEIVEDIIATAKGVRDRFDYFVVLGIGGSALGPIAVQQALNHLHYNELSKEKRNGCPKLYVEDNVDPERMVALFDVIEPEKTCFNVITKSGSTSETMTQYLIIWDMLKKLFGDDAKKHIIATTDAARGNLIKIADAEGFKKFVIPDGVGGRFSEMCPVGLLAAAVCGIDIKEMLAGAAYADKNASSSDFTKNAPLAAAVTQYLAMNNGMNISVMMPYSDSLKFIADWYCQLWGESLGKRYSLDGKEVFAGQTPVKALGVTDQHSQVQLYTEGPFDKVVTLIGVGEYRANVSIPNGCDDIPNVNFLCGHSMNELISVEREATEYALLKSGHVNQTIILPQVNAFTIGQLLYFYELETAYCGAMLGIDTFNQPGVEEGKNAAYAMLGRPGYDAKKQELEQRPRKKEYYIIK